MTTNLGQTLAQLLKNETDLSAAAAEKRARLESAEALANFNIVKQFFDNYRQTVADCLSQGKPSKDLIVTVGTTGRGQDQNGKVYSLLQMYSDNNIKTPPRITTSTHVYYALWKEFLDWATTSGLRPVWQYQHDGVGIHGWFTLTVTPLT
ncbi:MAG: hypothetical protein Q7S87_03315 [Agitococcus sp.]|nr:hypothetical protein [Agitococcus sp.]MDO9178665.1 hypothetical protein [Agitococcus sp.]